MKTIKTGIMPGKLVEVSFDEGMTAREIFELADITVDNHDIRLDGEKINLDTIISSGALLVGTKMIKGNAKTIKVGVMPGRLTEISYEGNETARELFELANVEISNHDIRLDGNKINIDDVISNGALLVATKMIKGNCDGCGVCECAGNKKYIAIDLTKEEVEMLLGASLPLELDENMVKIIEENFVQIKVEINQEWIIEKDMFDSVYTLVDASDIVEKEVEEKEPCVYDCQPIQKEMATLKPGYPEGYEANIKILVTELKEQRDKYLAWAEQVTSQIDVLNELEFRANNK